jgi:hypothetical protein
MIYDIAFFLLIAGGALVGGYFLLKKFDPVTADKIVVFIKGLLGR